MKGFKIFSILLVIIIVMVFVVSGCGAGTQQKESQESTKAEEETTQQDNNPKAVELSMVIDQGLDAVDDSYVQQELEKLYNIKIKLLRIPSDTRTQKLGLLLAAGDFPDVIRNLNDASGKNIASDYVKQEAIGEIPLKTIQKFAPDYFSGIEKYIEKTGVVVWLVRAINGRNYEIPSIGVSMTQPNYGRIWRKDILAKAGFDGIPKTIDEFEQAFAKVKQYDPSIYGLSSLKECYWQFASDIYNAYVGDPNSWQVINGKAVNTLVMPEMKDALTTLARWYKAGYIDPEYITDGDKITRQKFYSGKLLSYHWATYTYAYPYMKEDLSWEGPYYLAKQNDPNAEVVIGPNPIGPNGRSGMKGWLPFTSSLYFSQEMASDSIKVERFLRILNDACSKEEIFTLIAYGKEGVHWDKDAAGRAIYKEEYKAAEEQNKIGNTALSNIFYSELAIDKFPNYALLPERLQKFKEENWDIYPTQNNIFVGLENFGTVPPEVKVKATLNLEDLYKEYFDGIIIGKKDISEFDVFVEKWLNSGGRDYTDWFNTNVVNMVSK